MSVSKSPLVATLLVVAGFILIAAGYWGPWVWAEPAGLRILGLDLAEYVKFIAEVRSGQISVQREIFYLPLAALSLSLSLLAHRPELRLAKPLRWLANALAIPVALAMLPPAWTPPLLSTPEFIKQTIAIGFCLGAAALAYPLLRRLPWLLAQLLVTALAVAAIVWPIATFHRLRPALDAIYNQSITAGLGPLEMALGFTLLTIGIWLARAAIPKVGERP